MKLLKKRKFAILITVVVAIAATLFGAYRTAERQTREIEAMFYDGVYLKDQGYTQPGINSHLTNMANAALGLAVTLEKYHELEEYTDEILSCRRALIDSASISDMALACVGVYGSSLYLRNKLDETETIVTEKDNDAVVYYTATIYGAYISAFNGRYNDKVEEYLESRSAIVSLIGQVLPLKEPELFYYPYPMLF